MITLIIVIFAIIAACQSFWGFAILLMLVAIYYDSLFGESYDGLENTKCKEDKQII